MNLLRQVRHPNLLLILLSLLALVFTFVGKLDPYSPRSLHAFWNTGHIAAFFLWTILLLRFIQPLASTVLGKRLLICCLFALLAGTGIELMQTLFDREASVFDVANDVLGSLLAVAYSSKTNTTYRKSYRLSVLFIVCLVIAGMNYKVFVFVYDEVQSFGQFPVLADFTTPFQETRFKGNARLEMVEINSKKVMKLGLGTDMYSGFSLASFPRNWSGYSGVMLRFQNPGNKELKITCRIHDVQHSDGNEEYSDRFNGSYVLLPGETMITIPLDQVAAAPASRTLDLGRVGALGCFTIRLASRQLLYLYEIRLLE